MKKLLLLTISCIAFADVAKAQSLTPYVVHYNLDSLAPASNGLAPWTQPAGISHPDCLTAGNLNTPVLPNGVIHATNHTPGVTAPTVNWGGMSGVARCYMGWDSSYSGPSFSERDVLQWDFSYANNVTVSSLDLVSFDYMRVGTDARPDTSYADAPTTLELRIWDADSQALLWNSGPRVLSSSGNPSDPLAVRYGAPGNLQFDLSGANLDSASTNYRLQIYAWGGNNLDVFGVEVSRGALTLDNIIMAGQLAKPVPEPSSIAVLSLGLLTLLARRNRNMIKVPVV